MNFLSNKLRKIILICVCIPVLSCHNPLPPGESDLKIELAWSIPFENIYNNSYGPLPLINSGFVYHTTKSSIMYCRNLATGELIWQVDTESLGVISGDKILYSDGKIFINDFHFVKCYDANTGNLVWSNESSEVISNTQNSILSQYANFLFLPNRNKIIKINKDNGNIEDVIIITGQNNIFTNGEILNLSISDDGLLYIPISNVKLDSISSGTLYCYDLKTDEYIWDYNLESQFTNYPPAYQEIEEEIGTVVRKGIIDGDNFLTMAVYLVYSINRKTGDINWISQMDFPNFLSSSGISIQNDKLFVRSDTGKLFCIDANTGRGIWDFYPNVHSSISPGRSPSPIIAYENMVFIYNTMGFWIIDQNSSNELWSDVAPKFETSKYTERFDVAEGYMVFVRSSDVAAYKIN